MHWYMYIQKNNFLRIYKKENFQRIKIYFTNFIFMSQNHRVLMLINKTLKEINLQKHTLRVFLGYKKIFYWSFWWCSKENNEITRKKFWKWISNVNLCHTAFIFLVMFSSYTSIPFLNLYFYAIFIIVETNTITSTSICVIKGEEVYCATSVL